MIRVEPEGTQDYAREVRSRIFVPSAVGVPQKMMFRCDKQCSEKSLSYWQLASVESYTTDPTGVPSVRRCVKASKENIGKKYIFVQRNEWDCGRKEATGGPESKSFLANEGSQGCRRRILRPHA